MKDQLQAELKEKLIEGVKPSDLRKLKKSKSDSDLPKNKTQSLKHSKSTNEIPLAPPSPTTKIKELEDKVSVLELKLDTKDRELQEKTAELDNSLLARYEAVKQFGKIYDKLQKIKQELKENVDQASDELISQDEVITKLRNKQQKAQVRIQELESDLNLAQRLAQVRKVPYPNSDNNLDYLKYAFYSLCAITLAV